MHQLTFFICPLKTIRGKYKTTCKLSYICTEICNKIMLFHRADLQYILQTVFVTDDPKDLSQQHFVSCVSVWSKGDVDVAMRKWLVDRRFVSRVTCEFPWHRRSKWKMKNQKWKITLPTRIHEICDVKKTRIHKTSSYSPSIERDNS